MRWVGIAGAVIVIVGGIVYWLYQQRINAPLRPTGPEAEAALQAAIEAQDEGAFYRPEQRPPETKTANPLKNVYFGDLHIHTNISFDSYLFGNRLDPDTAYSFAKGESMEIVTGELAALHQPLDFAAVTDHAEGFGLHPGCASENLSAAAQEACREFDEPSIALFLRLRNNGQKRPPNRELTIYGDSDAVADEMSGITWQETKAAAERHYEPGRFTTFAGYEYSPPLPDTGKHHRNVIFRTSETPAKAYSMYDALSEIDLWKMLEANCQDDCQFLTIPHNPNKSWGLAFASETIDGVPYTDDDWRLRAKHEPIVEMFQIKGNSECSSAFGATDEECDFEQFFPPCEDGQETLCIFPTSMARDGLKKGLELEQTVDVNPMQFGMIGSTDTHNSNPGDTEEWDYRGTSAFLSSPAERRLSGGRGGSRMSVQRNPGGLAAVWAEENTREALFDAMKRKEVYATSGTRIRLRAFASDSPSLVINAEPDLAQLYTNGVPMGGELTVVSESPNFFVWAMKDPDSAPLAKVQMIKGWLEDGEAKEQVYDLVCANDDCESPTSTLDPSDCGWDNSAGAAELKTWWQDPDFDSSHNAFYYVRVVQNPTCRWTTYDAMRLGVEPPTDVPSTVQEMAWGSPIWVHPKE